MCACVGVSVCVFVPESLGGSACPFSSADNLLCSSTLSDFVTISVLTLPGKLIKALLLLPLLKGKACLT